MEARPYHIVWVSSTQFAAPAVELIASRQSMPPIHLTQAALYDPAIQAVQYASPDAIFVMDDADPLNVLEFVHHARLLNSQVPIIILCREYDAALDYKSHKLGATDCIPLHEVDSLYLHDLLLKRQPAPGNTGPQRKTMKRKSILQLPVLDK